MHDSLQAAAYLAIHRGSQIIVVYVADSPAHLRLEPMGFGFHEAPHATAFGKILLATWTKANARCTSALPSLPAPVPARTQVARSRR